MNGPDDVYVERKGRIVKADDRLFEREEAVLYVIERIVARLAYQVDAASHWWMRDCQTAAGTHPFLEPLSRLPRTRPSRRLDGLPRPS